MTMTFNTFEQEFVAFCETPGVKSGKARSYFLAIVYLAEYLNIDTLNKENVRLILGKEGAIRDSKCNFYLQLLKWLELRHQKSYLAKGYIKAALPYFRDFVRKQGLL
jgi:hypothetical protein